MNDQAPMPNDQQNAVSQSSVVTGRWDRVISPWPHRVAVALCCAAFPLIWVGGLVTTYDAGMAVPDWPTTYGYNLFAYPWKTWLFGPFDLFIEHGHRLLGAMVGFLAIGLVLTVFRKDSRRWMRYAAVVLLALVVIQGVLGGLRVRLDQRSVAMIHACFGLATFAFAAALATMTSRTWGAAPPETVAQPGSSRLLRLAVMTAGLTYVQVLLGALLRHVPVVAAHGIFRAAVWFHIFCGLAILVHVVLLAIRAAGHDSQFRLIKRRVHVLTLLVVVQIGLGLSTWVLKYGWPAWFSNQAFAAGFTVQANSLPQAWITTLHVAVGALILSLSVVIALRIARIRHFAGIGKSHLLRSLESSGHDSGSSSGARTALVLSAPCSTMALSRASI